MMRQLFLVLALASLLPGSPSAAEPADSLAGRKVHVYLPTTEWDSLTVMNWNIPMKRDGRFWYTATLRGSRFESNQGFYFATPGLRMKLNKSGIQTTETAEARFQVSDFQGRQEIWVIVDPSGPIDAPPVVLLEPPRIVNVLNPWPASGPRLAFAGGNKRMAVSGDHCGWFSAFLLGPAQLDAHFEEQFGAGTYGEGGLGSAANFDLAALFASKGATDSLGTRLWLDTETRTWTGAYPGKEGTCRFLMAATVRDFSSGHPDFDFGNLQSSQTVPGIVEDTLAPDRKPIRSAKPYPSPAIFNDFDSWWVTDTANANPALRSYETCVDIPMSKTSDGLWAYDGYATPDLGFYPIDGFANPNNERSVNTCSNDPGTNFWRTGLPPHNLNFCMEVHARFEYQRGQRIEFLGDDDAWIFIDNRLAMDLGGIHTPLADTVELDSLGLTAGQEYTFDFFYCERQPCASSLRMKVPIFFRQQPALAAVPDGFASGGFRIVKREGGMGSCAGGDTAREVPPGDLVYLLTSDVGAVLDTLEAGIRYGGIRLEGARIVVDTSAITGLPAGAFAVVAYEADNPFIRARIPFRAGGPVSLARPKAAPVRHPLGRRVYDLLGRMFPSRDAGLKNR